MYYLQLDAFGNVISRFDTTINTNIPTDAISISKEDFNFSIHNPQHQYINGQFVSPSLDINRLIEEVIFRIKELREEYRVGGIFYSFC